MSALDTAKTTWDLSPLLAGDDDLNIKNYREALTKAHRAFVSKWKTREDYLREPRVLREALDEYELLIRTYGTSGAEGYYFALRSEADQMNANVKGKFQKIIDFSTALENELQFFRLRLGKVPRELQEIFLQSLELTPYRHYLECLFVQSQYTLSEAEERIMNLKSSVAHEKWVKMVSMFISKEEH